MTSHPIGLAHDALKRETAELHEQVEARMDLPARLRSLDSYRDWLERLLGVTEPAEDLLGAQDWPEALSFAARRRAHLLRADLLALGRTSGVIDRLPRTDRMPAAASRPEALGWLYVFEGQTLGGRVILRQAQLALGVDETRGASFLAGYGDRTGAMWRGFLQVLADEVRSPAEIDEATTGARACFAEFERWLVTGAEAPERSASRQVA